MSEILKVNGLTKSYRSFLLDHVSFSVPRGSIMGFIGENGAGKTTAIKLILNEIEREAGEISVFGLDNIKEERKIKEQIGVVFDECYFHKDFRAKDISKIFSGLFKTWDQALFQRYLREFRIPEGKSIEQFSKGTKMKLSIASALAHHPKFLILDEATSGLDPIVRNEILDILREFILDENHAVLISTHITSDLEQAADYITFLHEGKIVFCRSKDDLIYSYGILKCGENLLPSIEKRDALRIRRNGFGCEVLVADKEKARARYRGCVVDNVSLEDIMLFYIKGEIL